MPGKKQKSRSVDSTLTTSKKNEASCDSQKEGSKEQTESTPVQPLLMETSATPSTVNSSNFYVFWREWQLYKNTSKSMSLNLN